MAWNETLTWKRVSLGRATEFDLQLRGPLTRRAGRRMLAYVALTFDLPEWRDVFWRFKYRARVYPALTPLAPPSDGLTVTERKALRAAERTIEQLGRKRT